MAITAPLINSTAEHRGYHRHHLCFGWPQIPVASSDRDGSTGLLISVRASQTMYYTH